MMERFFTFISRVNKVLIFLILLGIAGFIVSTVLDSHRWQRRGAVEVPAADSGTKGTILLHFGRLENIAGSDAQFMRLTASNRSAGFSSGGYGNDIRNVLFLRGFDKAAHWLFNEHNNIVLQIDQLIEEKSDSKERSALALYFEYVSEDSNHDDELSSEDHSNVALTLADGTGFVEVLHEVDRVFSYEMLAGGKLSVVYQKDATIRHARFSIADFSLDADREIVNVPGAL